MERFGGGGEWRDVLLTIMEKKVENNAKLNKIELISLTLFLKLWV